MDAEKLQSVLSEIVAARCREVEQMAMQWRRGSLTEAEGRIREWALGLGLKLVEALVEGIGEGSEQALRRCGGCGGEVQSEGRRAAALHTSMGDVAYARRYGVCPKCGEGQCPLDEELGLDEQRNSPALQRMVGLAGTVAPFEKAGELLREIGSIAMSAKKVERVTEEAGRRAERWMHERQQRALGGLEKPAGAGPKRLYVEADGTTVPMRVEAGEARSEGQRTKGKVEYREVKVGAVFEAKVNKEGKAEAETPSYTGTFGDAEECIGQVQAEARARGSQEAREIVVLTDGGEWLWNRLPAAFSGQKVTQILDWCHPSERLGHIAKMVWGEENAEGHQWAEQQRGFLYEGKTREVIEAVEQLKPRSEEAKTYVRQSLGYLKEHESRMNYGELRQQGYCIGSGVIESACKHIVGARLKQAGMKWSRDHVPKILALRVCWASGWWGRFWKEGGRRAAA